MFNSLLAGRYHPVNQLTTKSIQYTAAFDPLPYAHKKLFELSNQLSREDTGLVDILLSANG